MPYGRLLQFWDAIEVPRNDASSKIYILVVSQEKAYIWSNFRIFKRGYIYYEFQSRHSMFFQAGVDIKV